MKNIIHNNRQLATLLFIFTMIFASCKKDENDLPSNPAMPSGSTLKTTVVGKITDTDNMVVSGVTVRLGSQTTVTDLRGHFLFVNADVPKDRMVLKANKQGYFECIKGKRTQTGGVNYVDLVMQELPLAVNVSAVAGGVVNIPGGARITFPANAFVDAGGNVYTGTVKVYSRHFNPAADGFAAIVPGGDLIGRNTLGENVALYPMGMIEALLKDNSGVNEIKLATGVTAQLRMPIDPSQSIMAQNTVPLWYLDENNGIWKEEGEAVKNGNFFEGNVSHFSTWNCDYQGERTDIVGKLVDCQGVPVAGAVVTINGFMNVITNNNGEYSTWVPAGFVITCQVLVQFNPLFTTSNPQIITAIGGQLNIVPDISIPCLSRINGSIYICGTNQLTPAFIYISWNGGSQLFYSSDGNYSFMTRENITMNFLANSTSFTGIAQVTSGPLNSTVLAPPIYLCSQLQLYDNSFTINYNGDSSIVYIVTLNHHDSSNVILTDGNGDGIPDVLYMNYAGIAQHNSQYITYMMDIILNNGTLTYDLSPVGMLSWMFINNSVSAFGSQGSPQNTTNTLTIDDFGHPGGFINGRFEYDCGGGISITNGTFSVRRNN